MVIKELPVEYIVQQFYQYAGYASPIDGGRVYTGGCWHCREGDSWGKKSRLFYIPEYGNLHCKNCNQSFTPVRWIMDVSGKSYKEIMEESLEYEYVPVELLCDKNTTSSKSVDPLPKNSINLFDPQQLDFFKGNSVVDAGLKVLRERRLDTAVNRPNAYYISLEDYVHKNRLCIPFESESGDIVFYQTRTLFAKDTNPKYLGKVGGEKTVFGINNIDENIDYIFKFEGPLDSTFVKNGVGLCGVTQSKGQTTELQRFPFHQQIWVLDNQHIDHTAKEKTKLLVERGERVFIWPKSPSLKDFNDIAMASKINEIPTNFIIQNSFSGLQAHLNLKKLGL